MLLNDVLYFFFFFLVQDFKIRCVFYIYSTSQFGLATLQGLPALSGQWLLYGPAQGWMDAEG